MADDYIFGYVKTSGDVSSLAIIDRQKIPFSELSTWEFPASAVIPVNSTITFENGYSLDTTTLSSSGTYRGQYYDASGAKAGSAFALGSNSEYPVLTAFLMLFTDRTPNVMTTGQYYHLITNDSWGVGSLSAGNLFSGLTIYDEDPAGDDDPYSQGGNSGEGGGTGTFSGTGDSIDFPSLPTLSAVSTGFITLFNPSIAEMQNLATYMWSDVFDIGLYKTLFADPMDCILGCSIVPVAVPNGGTKTVNVGNVSTGISMTVAASQYVEVDCGTLNVEEYWGSYLDYDPYTKAEIYLPYCGTHALQVDDIMGKAVHVKYHVDILSGACCAYVKCGSSVMYSFVGQCSSSIPISANDWTNVVNGALTIAASVGSLIATGGASAPMAVGAAAAVTGTIYGGGIKQNVEKSGSMGGTGGMLAVQTPYLILTRPRQALPKKQNTYTGYPSFITTKLEDLKGYTEIDSIRITGVPATDAELNELESILKSGVIF
jgi:hypothetical protein